MVSVFASIKVGIAIKIFAKLINCAIAINIVAVAEQSFVTVSIFVVVQTNSIEAFESVRCIKRRCGIQLFISHWGTIV